MTGLRGKNIIVKSPPAAVQRDRGRGVDTRMPHQPSPPFDQVFSFLLL